MPEDTETWQSDIQESYLGIRHKENVYTAIVFLLGVTLLMYITAFTFFASIYSYWYYTGNYNDNPSDVLRDIMSLVVSFPFMVIISLVVIKYYRKANALDAKINEFKEKYPWLKNSLEEEVQ